MPQFDFFSFPGQVFWTLAGFFLFYFIAKTMCSELFSWVFKSNSLADSAASNTSLNSPKSERFLGFTSSPF